MSMDKHLRKAKFNLGEVNENDLTVLDHEADKNGILETRQEWFHRCGDGVYTNPETDKEFQRVQFTKI